jgi:hypothetical protein
MPEWRLQKLPTPGIAVEFQYSAILSIFSTIVGLIVSNILMRRTRRLNALAEVQAIELRELADPNYWPPQPGPID